METKTLQVPVSDIGHLIGKCGRNIHLLQKHLHPGTLSVRDNVVTLHGPLKNSTWRNHAVRVLRSARRGGILKWFDPRQRKHFARLGVDQRWLDNIRRIEDRTECKVHQHTVVWQQVQYEVWMVLERHKNSALDRAIEQIGTCVHKRYRH